jgi:hypothetical protein
MAGSSPAMTNGDYSSGSVVKNSTRSPDGAKQNPGLTSRHVIPHCAPLHAGYTLCPPPHIPYIAATKTKRLTDALERVENWPAEWQEQLADIALDIDAGLKDGVYHPSPEELEGIDRGLRDAEKSRFATEEEVEATFAKFRRR